MKKVIGWNNQKVTLLVIAVVIGGFLIGTVTGQAVRKGPGGGGGTGTTTTILPYCSSAPATQTFLVRDGDFLGDSGIFSPGDQNCLNNDPYDPDCWKWSIGELYSGGISGAPGNINKGEIANKQPTIAVTNDFTIDDDKDRPPTIGDCISIPNTVPENYFRICLDRLNVVDNIDYNQYLVRFDNSADLSLGGTPSQTSEPSIIIQAGEGLDNGLVVTANNFTDFGPILTNDLSRITTDKIILHKNDTTSAYVDIFYEDVDNRIKWAGSIIPTASNKVDNLYQKFAEINYRDTTGNNMQIAIDKSGGIGLVFDAQGEEGSVSRDSIDDLRLRLGNTTTAFNGLGNIPERAEPYELVWGWNKGNRSISTSQGSLINSNRGDYRTIYGMIIFAPNITLQFDTLQLEVPANQVKVITKIESCVNSICGGVTDEIPLNTSISEIGFIGSQLGDNNGLQAFQDTQIQFGNDFIDVHDELDLGVIPSISGAAPIPKPGPIMMTSLSAGDYDYGSGVYMEIPKRTITYSYVFDESIKLNSTSLSKPLTIKMLGKTVNIIGINGSLSFTHRSGYCGDRICRHEFNEYCDNCAVDCGTCTAPVCGNRLCEILESCNTCSTDCGICP